MPLSTAATKLQKYLQIYNITATNYNDRISGAILYENLYNINKFADNFGGSLRHGHTASYQKGLFGTALQELVTAGD